MSAPDDRVVRGDLSCCPRGTRCECCGREERALAVHETATPAGLVCLTLCAGCAEAMDRGMEPPITAGTAGRFAAAHRGHLSAAAVPAAQTWSASGP